MAITRHGDKVSYYIPVRPKRTDVEREGLKQAHAKLQEILSEEGISEDDLLADFNRWRNAGGK